MELVASSLAPVDDKAAALAITRFLASASAEGVPEAVTASLSALGAALVDGDKPRAARKAKRARRASGDAGVAGAGAGAGPL
jgi:hypothetical protein